jgi:uncharacterized protein
MARKKQKAKSATTLVPHRTPNLSALLDRAKNGDSAAAVTAYLAAGGSASSLVQSGGARAAQQLPLLHQMALHSAHPHTELAESVRLLVEAGADIDLKAVAPSSDDHRAAVMCAVQRTCCSKVLHAFLQSGADVSSADAFGTTALHLAAVAGRADSCELLLARADSSIHAKNENGWTALMHAAARGCLDVVQMLLQYGADVNVRDAKDRPLFAACKCNDADVAACLIEAGADVNAVDSDAECALLAAVQSNSSALVRLLLDSGADIKATGLAGHNALFRAVTFGHVPMMEILVRRGLKLTAVDSTGSTLLMLAVSGGQKLVAEWLLERRAAVNAVNEEGYTALHVVNINRFDADAAVIKLLLAHGADVHVRAKLGSTALNAAAHVGYCPCVKVLLAAGADVNSGDCNSLTSLQMAVTENHSAVAQLLLEHGATSALNTVVNVRWLKTYGCCCRGLTALMMCTTAATVQVLLAAGADVRVTTYAGDTCMHLAARHSLPVPVVCLLIKAEVDLHAVNHQGMTAAEVAHEKGNTLIEQLLIRAAQ